MEEQDVRVWQSVCVCVCALLVVLWNLHHKQPAPPSQPPAARPGQPLAQLQYEPALQLSESLIEKD